MNQEEKEQLEKNLNRLWKLIEDVNIDVLPLVARIVEIEIKLEKENNK